GLWLENGSEVRSADIRDWGDGLERGLEAQLVQEGDDRPSLFGQCGDDPDGHVSAGCPAAPDDTPCFLDGGAASGPRRTVVAIARELGRHDLARGGITGPELAYECAPVQRLVDGLADPKVVERWDACVEEEEVGLLGGVEVQLTRIADSKRRQLGPREWRRHEARDDVGLAPLDLSGERQGVEVVSPESPLDHVRESLRLRVRRPLSKQRIADEPERDIPVVVRDHVGARGGHGYLGLSLRARHRRTVSRAR